ncbi:MAG TPA: hypothetical protein VJ276_15670 [Thermoanaerobaculia bacterium]|nr:hypothetical protein [Thermoanaerobaculia bacterium]
MDLFHVAVVSQTSRVPLSKLLVGSAAVQKQVSRDFKPHWEVDATIDSYADLKDVPVGSWSVIIRDDIPFNAAGIHLNNANGQPFSLVRFSKNWSLTLSHEILEMLADPFGNRIKVGDSLMGGQGRVEYLVEVADPSEAAQFGYTVNGVLVSDFYTPSFFDPIASTGVRYSFNGKITAPRQVLEGGYISWRDPISTHVFQLQVRNGSRDFRDLGALPGGFKSMRAFADRYSSEFRAAVMEEEEPPKPRELLTAAAFEEVAIEQSLVDQSSAASADSLQAQIDALLGQG